MYTAVSLFEIRTKILKFNLGTSTIILATATGTRVLNLVARQPWLQLEAAARARSGGARTQAAGPICCLHGIANSQSEALGRVSRSTKHSGSPRQQNFLSNIPPKQLMWRADVARVTALGIWVVIIVTAALIHSGGAPKRA